MWNQHSRINAAGRYGQSTRTSASIVARGLPMTSKTMGMTRDAHTQGAMESVVWALAQSNHWLWPSPSVPLTPALWGSSKGSMSSSRTVRPRFTVSVTL